MFVDHIKIFAKAGDGGDGCCSFRREKFVPKGGPDGGDGGNGADVVLIVDEHTDNLREFFYRHNYKAERGKNGSGRKKTGKSGKDLILKVPPGTIVYRVPDDETKPGEAGPAFTEEEFRGEFIENEEGHLVLMSRDESSDELVASEEEIAELNGERSDKTETAGSADEESDVFDPDGSEADGGLSDAEIALLDEEELGEDEKDYGEKVADLTEVGDKFVLCEGGIGGKGNWNYRTDTNQAPIEFTMGTKGGEGTYYLELRRIADIGLVGFPNAGKSTLLGALSKAAPKVAAYPFTTLKPMVGVVEFPGYYRTTIADIPGLIEGASQNIGLGHDFLRHISRCSVFLFVVDAAGVDQRDPISDLQILRKELKLYDEELTKRPWLIVANKIDLEESEMYLDAIRSRFPKQEVFAISAQERQGLEELKARLCELAGKRPF